MGVRLVTSLWGIVRIKELYTVLPVSNKPPPSPAHVFMSKGVHWNKFVDPGEGEIACEERRVMIEVRGRETEKRRG